MATAGTLKSFNFIIITQSFVVFFRLLLQQHPRKLIPELCKQFYNLGWVTGTGGGISIKLE
jgi:hypothetical protein